MELLHKDCKSKLDILKEHFAECFDKDGKFNLEKFQSEIAANGGGDFTNESYSLNFLGKKHAKYLANLKPSSYLKQNGTFNENLKQNLLIKGDNLEVLKHLQNSYYKKIKMIYIDPPYNTANKDFVYNDTRAYKLDDLINAGMSEDEAKRVLEFSTKKSSSHSAWLTFMYPRLFLARKLLKDDGVIFISIDDNEAAQLKLLCDEIFGEENFVADFIWNNKYTTSNDTDMSYQHEHIFCYFKNRINNKLNLLPRSEKQNSAYKNRDNDPKGAWKPTPIHARSGSELGKYSITFPNGITWQAPIGRYPRYSKDKLLQLFYDNELYFNSKGGIDKKTYITEVRQGISCGSVWSYDEVGHTHSNNEELSSLLGKGIFNDPKGTKLLKRILQISTDKDDIVLDFFAGSGTTGHAIMQLNAEDSGNRKFILVQLDEPIDEKKSKIAYDFVKNELNCKPTIYAITKERLIRAAKKIKQDYPNATNLDFSEFKIVYKDELELEKIEKLDLSLGDNLFAPFNNDKTNEILTSYKLADGIALDMEFKIININDYKAYYCNKLLYLVFPHFKSENIKTLMQKLQDNELICERVILYNTSFTSSEHKSLKEALIKLGIKLQVRF
ncbi:site-specific DNA-methyltransferase [Campylobacter sp. RM12651]|uniref:site-specific DNA-methyltransferase n=1 Tax=Campylobacter sp. RM12651 TaxID=1660079 RepID=UPI001EFAB046|nr:site-specific DNA-methyltransferase [Campylobacter sp. RM12651]ULO03567.1 type III restriction/modification system, modification subunit [Campylobacter sp. RM12651]